MKIWLHYEVHDPFWEHDEIPVAAAGYILVQGWVGRFLLRILDAAMNNYDRFQS